MIKEALEYLINLGQVKTIEVNGQTYSTERLDHVRLPKVNSVQVNSLTGLIDYIKSDFDKDAFSGNLIHVVSFDNVQLISNILADAERETYMKAVAFAPKFNFGSFYDVESFIIAMQACFVPNDDTTKILKVVGNIKEETVRKVGDDGISQQVTAKSGIATVENVVVPNPVILAPFRTFIEIEQPASKFVFRMRTGADGPQCALFEADGGAWKLDAMRRVKEFIRKTLEGTDIPIIC